MNTNITLPPRK